MLGPILHNLRIILASFYHHFTIKYGSFWHHCGIISRSFWHHLWTGVHSWSQLLRLRPRMVSAGPPPSQVQCHVSSVSAKRSGHNFLVAYMPLSFRWQEPSNAILNAPLLQSLPRTYNSSSCLSGLPRRQCFASTLTPSSRY